MSGYDREAAARLFGTEVPADPAAGRPQAATIGCWIAITFAGLGLASALLGLVAWLAVGRAPVSPNTPMAFVFEHFRELSITQACFNLLILVGASNALRRVNWGRRVTQGLMSLLAVIFLALGFYMASSAPVGSGGLDSACMAFWKAGAIVSSILWGAGPAAAVLWLLERPSVKDWFALGAAVSNG